MKYNFKRLIMFLIIVLFITIIAYIVPIIGGPNKFKGIKYIEIFFPLFGFLVWFFFFINIEMCLRSDYPLWKAVLFAFLLFKSIKIYKNILFSNNINQDWLIKLFYINLICIIVSISIFTFLQII